MSNTNENKTNVDIDVTVTEETVLANPAVVGDDPAKPTTDTAEDEAALQAKGRDADASIATMMYDKLSSVFGAGSQLFSMEFPGRVLNHLDYAYPLEDHNSILRKPYTVAEKEFRLSDNMMDMSPIVQGPNGSYLSSIYNTALNNYTPKIDNLKDFIIDKMELRLFLLEKITDEIDGEPITCSRMEFCQRTYLKYLETKYKWDQEKIEKQEYYTASDELDAYAKWLTTTSWTRDHELETLFNDAVVRGFYHEIMTILGFLDISSPAERLTAAKQNKRSSIRRSVDSSRDILPVQFEPSNWFRSLLPNYSPKDLTLDAGYLATEYQAKKALLYSLESELRTLMTANIGVEEISKLETEVENQKKALLLEEEESFKAYTQAQIDAVKLAFEIVTNGEVLKLLMSCADSTGITTSLNHVLENTNFLTLFGADKDTKGEELKAIQDKITSLIDGVFNMYQAHIEYFQAFEDLMDAQLAFAQSKTSNYDDQIQILTEKIRLLKQELNQIGVVLTSDAVNSSTPSEAANSSTDLLPMTKYDEDTTFTDIVISTKSSELEKMNESSSTHAAFKGSVGAWLINSSTSVDYSASSSKFVQNMMDKSFQIGLRATKVTIDRGGWFDPSVFDISASFMKLDEKISSGAGLKPESIVSCFENKASAYATKSGDKVSADLSYVIDENGTKGTYILPAFPTSFIIVKDVVVKFTEVTVDDVQYEEFRKTTVNTSTQIFGLKMSGGYGSESHMGYVKESNGTMSFYIRIPGPQILGWFMEMTPEDRSTKYESLSKSAIFSDIMAALKDYRARLSEISSSNMSSQNDIVEVHIDEFNDTYQS